ncbi:creatininase family protein [Pseudolysinimonas sp.]|uniref:creatininase family protein n=1 Tax=Pseudolysinimonas sp. TaxID=2680009 RepID=UPI003F813A52
MTRELTELAGPVLADTLTSDSVVVLPVGSIEHHGPHLPLATDYLMADLISRRLVDAAVEDGLDVWRLPAIAYSKSDEHHWAPGTVWIGWETLMRTVVEIGESVSRTPARTLVFFNGHGGNVALLQVALREIRRLYGLRTFLMGTGAGAAGDGANGSPDEKGLGIHGGYGETSVILHLRPDLVDISKAARWIPEDVAALRHLKFNGGAVSFGWLSNDFDPAGVIGDATGANAEHGAELVERGIRSGVEALHEIAGFRGGAA